MLTRPKQVQQQSDSLREQILSLGEEFFAEREAGSTLVPGQTYIPCSGKVLDARELRNILDA